MERFNWTTFNDIIVWYSMELVLNAPHQHWVCVVCYATVKIWRSGLNLNIKNYSFCTILFGKRMVTWARYRLPNTHPVVELVCIWFDLSIHNRYKYRSDINYFCVQLMVFQIILCIVRWKIQNYSHRYNKYIAHTCLLRNISSISNGMDQSLGLFVRVKDNRKTKWQGIHVHMVSGIVQFGRMDRVYEWDFSGTMYIGTTLSIHSSLIKLLRKTVGGDKRSCCIDKIFLFWANLRLNDWSTNIEYGCGCD